MLCCPPAGPSATARDHRGRPHIIFRRDIPDDARARQTAITHNLLVGCRRMALDGEPDAYFFYLELRHLNSAAGVE